MNLEAVLTIIRLEDLSGWWNANPDCPPEPFIVPSSATHQQETIHAQDEFNNGLSHLLSAPAALLANPTMTNIPAFLSASTADIESMTAVENNQRDAAATMSAMEGAAAMPRSQPDSHAGPLFGDGGKQDAPVAIGTITTPTQMLNCIFPECEGRSFSRQCQLDDHLAQKHTRPHECPRCRRRFGAAKDRDRHMQTVHRDAAARLPEILVCDEVNCRRQGRPFSRRDNYIKHLRDVHSVQCRGRSEDVRRRRSSPEGSCELESCDEEVAAMGGDAKLFGRDQRRGKRKAADLHEEDLESIPRDGLIRLLRQEKQKTRRLEEEIKADKRRYEQREDLWLKLVATKDKGWSIFDKQF